MTVLDKMEVQYGKEVAWGTSVAGTVRLMDVIDFTMDPITIAKIFQNRHGTLGPGTLAAVEDQRAAAVLSGMLTYEDGCYPLEGLIDDVSPTGAGPYVRAYDGDMIGITPRFFTVLYGEGSNVYKIGGGLVNTLNISGESGESDTELKMNYTFLGRQVSSGATLAALSDRTVTPVMASHVTIAVDTWAGTMGATVLSDTGFAFELGLDVNRFLKKYLGSILPTNHDVGRADPSANTLKMSLEFNATSKAFLDAMIAPALFQKQVRIKATSGTDIFQLDFCGTAVEAPTLFEDRDGGATLDFVLQATENATYGDWFGAEVTNDVATLP